MKKLSTRHRLIIYNFLPTLLLSTVLGCSFLTLRLIDIQKAQLDEGIAILKNYSYLVQTSLNGGSPESIQDIAYYILDSSNATSVTIFNAQKTPVAKAGPQMSPVEHDSDALVRSIHHSATFDSIRFTTPLLEDLLSPANTLVKDNKNIKNWGWIEIELPSHATSVKRYQAVMLVVFIMLISWLLHLAIILQRAHHFDILLSKFSQAFSGLKAGNFKTTIKVDGSNDINLLAAEFNSMCYALQQSHEELYKSMQQANDDINETLETIEIQNIELDLARKEAVKASQTKSEFLANMSHEIRTPLNGILGFTKLLAKSNLSTRQQEQVEIIQKSANALLALINDILDFSKIEAGKLEIDQSTFNLREVIEEVIDMLAPLAEEKRLELILLYYPDTPSYMVGDSLRVKQVVTNLVNNGIKFSNNGNVIIQAMLENDSDAANQIKVSITDQGKGLTQKEQSSLFQAFNQLNKAGSTSKDGTGLGLVISKHLTELMGGEINCISEQNKGATFWFTFRARKDPMGDSPPSPTVFSYERIALYDENPSSRLAIAQQLRQLDVQFDEFEILDDLTSAVREKSEKNTPYHLAIISLSYSQEGSPIIPITIENIEKILHCRVMVISHSQSPATFQALLDRSASISLNKPIRFKQTLKALQVMMKKQSTLNLESTSPQNPNFEVPPKILAVDDTPTNLQLLCIFLQQLGADVSACGTGAEAIQLVEKNDFDLVFMDYRMPDMDGLEATKLIRENEEQDQHTPIIGLTALAMKEEKRMLIEAGMDDCIIKPVDEKQLYQIIRRWVTPYPLPTPVSPIVNKTYGNSTSKEISSEKVVDINESVRLMGGKRELAREMFEKFIASLSAEKEKIIAQQSNFKPLLETIHALHGATKYYGTPRLRARAHASEILLSASKLDEGAISKEINSLLEEIDALIKWATENPLPAF